MDDILEILVRDARRTPEDIARMTGRRVEEVRKAIRRYERNGTIVGYKTLVDPEMVAEEGPRVRALIEVSVSPQKALGFDRTAERIYNFPEVVSCYLVSGTYDLLVVVEGPDIRTVARFIAEKLSPLESVRSTATHFLLKRYKEDGHILKRVRGRTRQPISF